MNVIEILIFLNWKFSESFLNIGDLCQKAEYALVSWVL